MKALDGRRLLVYETDSCPENKTDWLKRSSALNCTKLNGYLCIPNENITGLLEFCYYFPKIPVPKGVCLFLRQKHSVVDGYTCNNCFFGCPTNPYHSDTIYEQKSCLFIGKGCFLAETHLKRFTYTTVSANKTTAAYSKEDITQSPSFKLHIYVPIIIVICILFTVLVYIFYRNKKSLYFSIYSKSQVLEV